MGNAINNSEQFTDNIGCLNFEKELNIRRILNVLRENASIAFLDKLYYLFCNGFNMTPDPEASLLGLSEVLRAGTDSNLLLDKIFYFLCIKFKLLPTARVIDPEVKSLLKIFDKF